MTTEPLNLLTVSEAAHVLRETPTTVRKRIRNGELAVVRIGHKWLIDAGDLPRPERIRTREFATPAAREPRAQGRAMEAVARLDDYRQGA